MEAFHCSPPGTLSLLQQLQDAIETQQQCMNHFMTERVIFGSGASRSHTAMYQFMRDFHRVIVSKFQDAFRAVYACRAERYIDLHILMAYQTALADVVQLLTNVKQVLQQAKGLERASAIRKELDEHMRKYQRLFDDAKHLEDLIEVADYSPIPRIVMPCAGASVQP